MGVLALASFVLVALPFAALAAPTLLLRPAEPATCHASGEVCALGASFLFSPFATCCDPKQWCIPRLTSGDFRCGTFGDAFPSFSHGTLDGFPFEGFGASMQHKGGHDEETPAPSSSSDAPPASPSQGTTMAATVTYSPAPLGSTAATAPTPGSSPMSSPNPGPAPSPAGACKGVRTQRKEIMDLSDDEWNRYVRALHAVQQSGVYGTIASYHDTYNAQAHGGCFFLPWHRQYLFEFERELTKIDPTVAIPYWDWTKKSPDSASPVNERYTHDPMWNRMGGSNGGPIPNAPFQNWVVNGRTATRGCRTNNGNTGADGRPYTFMSSHDVYGLSHASSTYFRMEALLEGSHSIPHIAVGGDMGSVPLSPIDPLFWSHHAFIDKIYFDWQKAGNGNAFDGTHGSPSRNCVLDSEPLGPPVWGRTVRQILEDVSQCVTYSPSPNAGPTFRFAVIGSATAEHQYIPYGFGSASASASSSALAFSSATEFETYRERVAKRKVEQPMQYRNDVQHGVNTVDSMKHACQLTNLPQDLIQTATDAYSVLLFRRGVDIVNDKAEAEASAEASASGGFAQASAFSSAQASSS
jgi:hypothetical protein